jgi:hypothetical protein
MKNIYENQIIENAPVWKRFLGMFVLVMLIIAGASFNTQAQSTVIGDDDCEDSQTVISISADKNEFYHLLRTTNNGSTYTWVTFVNGQGKVLEFAEQDDAGKYEVWKYTTNPVVTDPAEITADINRKQTGEVYIYANPVPLISGEINPCFKSTSTYTTETGMSNYVWSITNGTITGGGGTSDNTVTVNWNGVSGAASVSVSYTESHGSGGPSCTSAAPTVYNVDVKYPVYIGSTGYSTLQAAINEATTGAEIDLVCDHTEGFVAINKAVIIDGNNNKLTSTSATYGLAIQSAGVTIKNITVDDAGTFGIHQSPGGDNLLIENVTVKNSGRLGDYGTGFAMNCSENILLKNITAIDNSPGNGVSITNCENVTIDGIITSGNIFATFSAGIGIFSNSATCAPDGTSGFDLKGTVSISEPVKVYEQAATGTIANVTLPSSFTHYLGFNNDKYYAEGLNAALTAAEQTLIAYPALKPAIFVKEIATGNLFVSAFSTTSMSIQAAINAAESGKTITVGAGIFAENIVANKSVVLFGANANVACIGGRSGESLIAPASGLPFSVTASGVTINGFEITAPGSFYAINCGNTSNTSILFNNIHDIGTTVSGGNVHSIIYTVANSASTENVTISDNCFNNISSSSLTGFSASAIGILQSTSTGVLTNLKIENNTIDYVNAKTAEWSSGGRIAYGIQINVGGNASYLTNGKVVSASIKNNNISNLTGFIATGIGLEGNTENAVVDGNTVSNLTGYKLANRAGGGYDLQALKFENNRYVGTVTVANNSFQTNTFAFGASAIPDKGYAVANYVPMTVNGYANLGCNWYGTANYGELVAEYATYSGKIFNKAGAGTDFVNYSTVASPINCLGVNATPANLQVAYDHAGENVVVTFDVAGNSSAIYPIPGLTTQADITAKYVALQTAILGGNANAIKAAALEIGDDIITEYYYLNGGSKVYLKTTLGNDLIKNKYWDKYLNNTSTSLQYPFFATNSIIVPVGNYSTSTNPLTNNGETVTNGWLAPVYGKDLHVTVTFLHNGEVTTATQSVAIPAAPVVNINKGLGYLSVQTAINNANANDVIEVKVADFTEPGQIHVNKSVTLQGQGKGLTTLRSNYNTTTADHGVAAAIWIYSEPGVTFHLKDMTLDANGINTKYAVVFKDDGSVTNVGFNEIKHSGWSVGYGIAVQVLDGDVDVTGCTFTNIGRIGVHYRAGVISGAVISGTFDGNTYTGKGAINGLDYALDISGDATVTVTNNTITNCLGVASSDGSTSGAVMATTFFPYLQNLPNNVTIENNILTGNTAGVVVGYDENDASNVTVHNNDLSGNTNGVSSIVKTVNATCNWWGSTDPTAVEASTEGYVQFLPFLVSNNLVAPDCSGTGPVTVWDASHTTLKSSHMLIQAGVEAAIAGDIVEVAAGAYFENITIDKRITLNGASSATTTIQSATASTPVITVTGTGTDATNRLVISDFKITGATGSGNPGSGILVIGSTACGYMTFSGLDITGNGGEGLAFNNTFGVTDIIVSNSSLSSNTGSGLRIASAVPTFDGLSVSGCAIENNGGSGFSFNPSSSQNVGTNFSFTNTNFNTNNTVGTNNVHDVSMLGFNGSASFTNVNVTSSNPNWAMVFGGYHVAPFSPAGAIVFNNVNVSGSVGKSGVYFFRYSEASSVNLTGLDVKGLTAGWGPQIVCAHTTGSLNLGNTSLKTLKTESTGTVDATTANFFNLSGDALDKGILADNFQIENQVYHALDATGLGLVTWVPSNVYVTTNTLGIQRGIDVVPNSTVNVGPGTFNEDVNINKAGLQLLGSGIDVTILRGTYAGTNGGSAASLFLNANDILVQDMTVTRNYGADLAAWYASTKNQGITFGQTKTGNTINRLRVIDQRNAIYVNNAQNFTITNCIVENSRTGIQMANNLTGGNITNNFFRNTYTHGLMINFDLGVVNGTDLTIKENSFTGNWYSEVYYHYNTNNTGSFTMLTSVATGMAHRRQLPLPQQPANRVIQVRFLLSLVALLQVLWLIRLEVTRQDLSLQVLGWLMEQTMIWQPLASR